MDKLSEDAKALLRRPLHGWATTVRPDGSLHNTVVWVDVDGDDVIINTAVGRAKEKHLKADPRMAVSVKDPDNDYHYLSVSGTARLETEGADAVIDRLAKKYLGADRYPFRQPGEKRVTVRLTPEKVIYSTGA
ncbi:MULTISPECIES: PPOX class F420-dependent oxidoreductase [Thermomonospora]|uniref:Pyridoxamine 5'-phosphate oxidase-related FMN-binding protein n=1 Tax=Thermomonospora curvata (strain ATCC 19995 / DSM 43183 / JCM 3096 / KCTC 9072 / NBRC 15933 / NCIMB 10081 / Henssen B9) TaxID=471852 RepID=D1A5R9_THECD|nr:MULTISPECIES: PPOX class F420-dependent oxidoreductase [Thermomonospora]ACY98214.1 pyridoxamine 5'-phosphate oxidase-related FMN- binding protein [Thermomonospora curvata DSM 43183]PKK13981.1 MAG: TIGR03618 family F420-dependent PPOX class oxidoreductase [Thermomonospora sp. CIF 1]